MRILLLLVSLVIVSLLVLKGYPGGGDHKVAQPAGNYPADPIKKANDVNQLILDTANKQKQALEQQIQQ